MPYKKSDDPTSMPLTAKVITEPLRRVAEYYDYIATRGPHAKKGDVVELAVAIGSGEIALVLLPDEQRSMAIRWLREQAELIVDPSLSQALGSIAKQLDAAAIREYESEEE